jgi:hypothetical protein
LQNVKEDEDMGTRGSYGVHVDGTDKLTYKHMDSYPGGLGRDLAEQVRKMLNEWGPDGLIEKARALTLVPEDGTPTQKQVDDLAKLHELIGNRGDWYSVLRGYQGHLDQQLAIGLMTDGTGFVNESLFCEWAYVLNLDEMTFEVYRGFQKAPHDKGRYAKNEGHDGYYPVALVKTFPLRGVTPEDVASLDA